MWADDDNIEYDYNGALRNGPLGGSFAGGQQIYRRVTVSAGRLSLDSMNPPAPSLLQSLTFARLTFSY
jgi:hypothetical protein